MERYKFAPRSNSLICNPLAVAIWYGEQVAPVPLPSPSQSPKPQFDSYSKDNHHDKPSDHLSEIAAPYNVYLHYLSQMLAEVKPPLVSEDYQCDAIKTDETYDTGLGILSFAVLHERTRKYAAFVLHHTYQVHPNDIDDGLQAGYSYLWEQLKQEPDILKDKQLAWIGKGIVYKALHAIRHDWTYQKYTQAEEGKSSTDRRGTHSPESRQIDMRIDLHQAIATVANHILTNEKGKQADYDLWALYGLTMLHVSSSELSRLFHVREQSMHAAYNRIRERLKVVLPHYAPPGQTKRAGQHGPEVLPRQDMTAIRQANENISLATYEAVRAKIVMTNADTQSQDEIALEGIWKGISISIHARKHGFPQYQMQRAYKRVHLMIAAEHDPTVRTLRPERRVKYIFTLTPKSSAAVEQLALDFLKQPKSYEKLVALHAHISNLAISTTAKHFNIPISTLRYYSQQIGKCLKTPTQSKHQAI
jgi:hypothetical protein